MVRWEPWILPFPKVTWLDLHPASSLLRAGKKNAFYKSGGSNLVLRKTKSVLAPAAPKTYLRPSAASKAVLAPAALENLPAAFGRVKIRPGAYGAWNLSCGGHPPKWPYFFSLTQAFPKFFIVMRSMYTKLHVIWKVRTICCKWYDFRIFDVVFAIFSASSWRTLKHFYWRPPTPKAGPKTHSRTLKKLE